MNTTPVGGPLQSLLTNCSRSDAMAAVVDSFSILFSQVVQDSAECMTKWTKILAFVGACYTLRLTLKKSFNFLHWLVQLKAKFSKKNFIKEYGRWAVITGGTSGIGEAFTYELASRGMNIILLGRSKEKMTKLARHVENLYGISCVILVIDFSSSSIQTIVELEKLAYEMDIGVLLNSAGLHYSYPMLYHEVDLSVVESMVKVNMESVATVTRAVLPGMIQRRRGLIVNMSSSAGMMPTPYISLYSASKVFVEHLSSSIRPEVEPYNIHVQSLCPMYVSTGMTAYSKALNQSKWLTPLPDVYAKHAIRTFGHYESNTGYFPHYLQTVIMKNSPRFLTLSIGMWMHRFLNSEGKEHMKKDC